MGRAAEARGAGASGSFLLSPRFTPGRRGLRFLTASCEPDTLWCALLVWGCLRAPTPLFLSQGPGYAVTSGWEL